MVNDVRVRKARPGDGEAIAQMHLENAAYYRSLSPKSFRLPDEDGLIALVEPAPDANSQTRLELVAEINGRIVVGHLAAHVIEPREAARFQMVPCLGSRRLWIDSLRTLRRFWRRGIGSPARGDPGEVALVATCNPRPPFRHGGPNRGGAMRVRWAREVASRR